MGSWPQSWTERGDGHTTVSSNPRKAMSLSFRCYIEGSSYTRPTTYVSVDIPDNFRQMMQEFADEGYKTQGGIKKVADPGAMRKLNYEWLAISTHTEGYPSGGSVEYASYAYFDRTKLYTGGQTSVQWRRAQFYKIDRGYITLQEVQSYQSIDIGELPEVLVSRLSDKNRDHAKGYTDGEAFMLYISSRYARE